MKKIERKYFVQAITFTVLFLVLIYKLTNASLWFDETIEYYYSKTLVGAVPGQSGISSMYQRIISTFQPPLYNIIMFFWLKIGNSEYWFRFFGVIMGMVSALGVYKTVEKICNYQLASISVFILAFTKQYVYYIQECAEYNLMLAGLSWTIYAWVCLLEKVNLKRMVFFIVMAVLSVYSQYGAAFLIVGLAVSSFIYIMLHEEKKQVLQMGVAYLITLIVAVIPLLVFFMSKQVENQQTAFETTVKLPDNWLKDIVVSLKEVIEWELGYRSNLIIILGIILLILLVVVFVFSSNKWTRYIIIANGICWGLYYIAVKYGVYSYGNFGNRYSLFFIPMWVVSLLAIVFEARKIGITILKEKEHTVAGFRIVDGILILCLIFFCLNNWNMIRKNWIKEDIRGTTEVWYDAEGYKEDTLIYYSSAAGFSYYLEQNTSYKKEMRKKITFMQSGLYNASDEYLKKTEKQYEKYLDGLYNGKWPNRLYIVATHLKSDFTIMLRCFEQEGYVINTLYNQNGGHLLYLEKQR